MPGTILKEKHVPIPLHGNGAVGQQFYYQAGKHALQCGLSPGHQRVCVAHLGHTRPKDAAGVARLLRQRGVPLQQSDLWKVIGQGVSGGKAGDAAADHHGMVNTLWGRENGRLWILVYLCKRIHFPLHVDKASLKAAST